MKPSLQPAEHAAPSLARRPGQNLKLFAAAIFLAMVLPMLFLAGLLAWHQYRILTTWPAVDAVVTKVDWTRTTTRTSRQPIISYGARFTFRYTAQGLAYDSSTDLGYNSSIRSNIERWMAQMPTGSHQRIRYDPGNPAHISLAVEYTPRSFAAPYTLAKWAGIIGTVGLFLYGLGWRAGKRESGVSSE